MSNRRPPTNLRAWKRREQRHLAWWVVFFLAVVGGLAIAAFYGWGPALLGEVCLLGGVGLFGLIWLILSLLERWGGEE